MFLEGGRAYIYLCYGIHHLFNIVTNKNDIPHAVLIRALEPLDGIDAMLHRREKEQLDHTLTRGPGNLSKAMGLTTKYSGHSLLGSDLFIADDGVKINARKISHTSRIGVDYAGEDAKLLYRFFVKGNPYVSALKK
jgi:DNA-3-methyladenine glycosylase